MADDILIKIGLDDKGLGKHFKNLSTAIDKFTKGVKVLSSEQIKLKKSEIALVQTQQKLSKASEKNNKSTVKQGKAVAKLTARVHAHGRSWAQLSVSYKTVRKAANGSQVAFETLKKAESNSNKESQAHREQLKKNELQLKKTAQAAKKAASLIVSTKGADAKRANTRETVRETAARQKSLASLKADIIARSASDAKIRRNTKSLNLNATALNRVYKGMIDITTKGRLVNNSFATLRSKLLLASFAFGLVGAAITRNIKAFAEQQEAVARLALQFGSAASKELSEYAASLQQVTRFGDELIIGMMSQFGAFGANIDQTKALTEATLDLAEGQGMDLNSAAQLVAKSFGSSTNALQRYGIEITKNSTKQEKINQIITQSQKKYGGLSKLLGSMSGSSVKKLSNAFGDLTERIGEVLAEGITPLVSGLQKMTDAMGTTGIRVLIEAVTSLGVAYAGLKIIAFGGGMLKAIGLATRKLTMVKAVTLGAGRAALTAAASTRVFTAALAGSTGGISLLVAGAVTLGIMLLEWSGLFKKTKEETEAADKELNKYHETVQGFNTEKGMGQLDAFYKKLVEGNQLLIIANTAMKKDLIKELPVPKNQTSFAKEETFRYKELKQQITANSELQKTASTNWLSAYKKELKGIEPSFGFSAAAWKTSGINLKADLVKLKESFARETQAIQDNVDSLNLSEFKSQFVDATGVTSDFFDSYIANSGLMEGIQSGLIDSNQGLVDVVDVIIAKGGNWLELSDKKRKALIEEIILKGKSAKASKDAAVQEIKWAELSAGGKSRLVGQTMKAGADLLASQGKNAKEAARLNQLGAIADTYAAATTAVKNPIKMAAIIMAGLANVIKIEEALNAMGGSGSSIAPPTFADGGYVGGNRHSQGGTMIEAERGEFVMSRNAVESIGLETLNQMNQGGGGGNINVSVTGNVMTQDFVEDELAEAIKEAVRKGSDFGMDNHKHVWAGQFGGITRKGHR